MAGHLVASSATGHWSYLLLNEIGCPTDPTTFPALSKDPIDNRSLIATFTAFKFPESQLVRFNVIVKFCLDKCEPVSQHLSLLNSIQEYIIGSFSFPFLRHIAKEIVSLMEEGNERRQSLHQRRSHISLLR